MTTFDATIKSIKAWKSGKGEFVEFDEQPGKFWKWGVSTNEVGTLMRCECIEKILGDTGANILLQKFEPASSGLDGWTAKGPMQKSALPDVAKATGGKVQGGIEALPISGTKFDAVAGYQRLFDMMTQLRSIIGIMQARIDELEAEVKRANFKRGAEVSKEQFM